MHRDFEDLLSALNDERVKYVIVGGYAVSVNRARAAARHEGSRYRPTSLWPLEEVHGAFDAEPP